MGRDTSGMAGCWRAWCATREGQKALPLAAGTPRATGTRSPSGSLTVLIIKCFDLSFSWFLEVPRADLSVPHPSLTIYSSCLRLVHGLYSLPWPRAPFRLRFNVSGRGSRVSFGRLTQVTEGGMTFGDSLTLVTQPTSAPYPLSSLKF